MGSINQHFSLQLACCLVTIDMSIVASYLPPPCIRHSPWSLSTCPSRQIRGHYVERIPPITYLSPEILSEIFMIYAYNEDEGGELQGLSTLPTVSSNPFILGQVCGCWRSVVTSMPVLWSSLDVSEEMQCQLPLIRLWLNRAGKCPLNISARGLFPGEDPAKAKKIRGQLEKLFDLLLEYSQRWKRINFDLSGLDHPLQNLPQTLLSLESATLRLHGDTDRIWRTIFRSPSLRCIAWPADDFENLPAYAPWGQLTHITFFNPAVEFLCHLRQCANLEGLTIHNLVLPPAVTINTTLLKLRTLCVNIQSPHDYLLFDLLTLPLLENLTITGRAHSDIGLDRCRLVNFLHRTSSRIKAFELSDWYMKAQDLVAYLTPSSVASISQMVLTVRNMDDVIPLLTCNQSDDKRSSFLPRLDHLSLHGDLDSLHRAVVELITSREGRDNVIPLKTVLINSSPFEDYY